MAIQQKEKNMMGGNSAMVDSAKEAANKTGELVKDSAKDTANKTGDAVKDAASSVTNTAADAGSYIADKAGEATTAVGEGMTSLAGTIRDKGPQDGMLGNAGSAVAKTLEDAGRELKEHGLSGIANEITNTVRRHPIPAVLIGIGVGFVLARVISK